MSMLYITDFSALYQNIKIEVYATLISVKSVLHLLYEFKSYFNHT